MDAGGIEERNNGEKKGATRSRDVARKEKRKISNKLKCGLIPLASSLPCRTCCRLVSSACVSASAPMTVSTGFLQRCEVSGGRAEGWRRRRFMASSKHTCQGETGPGDSGSSRDGELFVAHRLQLHQQRDGLSADLTLSDSDATKARRRSSVQKYKGIQILRL